MPPCFADRYNFGKKLFHRWGRSLQEAVRVNCQIEVTIDKKMKFQEDEVSKSVRQKW